MTAPRSRTKKGQSGGRLDSCPSGGVFTDQMPTTTLAFFCWSVKHPSERGAPQQKKAKVVVGFFWPTPCAILGSSTVLNFESKIKKRTCFLLNYAGIVRLSQTWVPIIIVVLTRMFHPLLFYIKQTEKKLNSCLFLSYIRFFVSFSFFFCVHSL